jgi:hypothetical protein
MLKRLIATVIAAVISTVAICCTERIVLAQAPAPGLPGAPQPTPNFPSGPQSTPRLPQGPQGGSGSYAISAAANEHASFLWVLDNVQRAVVLCEKTEAREFTCTKKPLP